MNTSTSFSANRDTRVGWIKVLHQRPMLMEIDTLQLSAFPLLVAEVDSRETTTTASIIERTKSEKSTISERGLEFSNEMNTG